MNAEYTLSHDFVFCEVDGGAIFLNLQTQRYFGVGAEQFEWLRARLCCSPNAGGCKEGARTPINAREQATLEEMVSRGVLVRGNRTGNESALRVCHSVVETPSASILNYDACVLSSGIRAGEIAAFAWAVLNARVKLRLLELKGTIRSLKRRAAAIDRKSADRAVTRRLVAVFLQLRPWFYTARDKCLFDSLVLVEFLHRYHVSASYVIGVTAKPFSAHCWVQSGAVVLNDDVERVAQFTPILSV